MLNSKRTPDGEYSVRSLALGTQEPGIPGGFLFLRDNFVGRRDISGRKRDENEKMGFRWKVGGQGSVVVWSGSDGGSSSLSSPVSSVRSKSMSAARREATNASWEGDRYSSFILPWYRCPRADFLRFSRSSAHKL